MHHRLSVDFFLQPVYALSMTATNTSKHILIADDEQYIRELYQEVLAAEGFTVETAKDGKAALEKILTGGWDIIALDVIMPQLDGLSILDELQRTKPKQPNGPIILLTSLINDPAVREAEQKGVSKILYKTEVNPQQLIDIVKELIAHPPVVKKPNPAPETEEAKDAVPAASSATPASEPTVPAAESSSATTPEKK